MAVWNSDRRRAIAALTTAGLLWGTTVPLSKLATAALAGGTLLPFTLFAYGQSRMSAEVAGAFLNLEPLVGAVAGVVVFGNPAGPGQLAGGTAILAGIGLSSLPLLGGAPRRHSRQGSRWRRMHRYA
jgi:drug/metabolite transporter (DMT)-like permease